MKKFLKEFNEAMGRGMDDVAAAVVVKYSTPRLKSKVRAYIAAQGLDHIHAA